MSAYELAQLNIGIIKGPMDSPVMADFAANLQRINLTDPSTRDAGRSFDHFSLSKAAIAALGYRSPAAASFGTARSMAARSSAESLTSSDPTASAS